MGAYQFRNSAIAETPGAAFARLRDQALYEHGHGGYTGTIAEKVGFTFVGAVDALPSEVEKFMADLEDAEYEDDRGAAFKLAAPEHLRPFIKHLDTYTDKWANAVGFEVIGKAREQIGGSTGRLFAFIGWASS